MSPPPTHTHNYPPKKKVVEGVLLLLILGLLSNLRKVLYFFFCQTLGLFFKASGGVIGLGCCPKSVCKTYTMFPPCSQTWKIICCMWIWDWSWDLLPSFDTSGRFLCRVFNPMNWGWPLGKKTETWYPTFPGSCFSWKWIWVHLRIISLKKLVMFLFICQIKLVGQLEQGLSTYYI